MKNIFRLLLAYLTATLAWAAAPPWAITNARILVAPGKTIAQGVILLRDGLIQAAGETVAIPPDAMVYDAKGLTVCAGWIDAGTYFGFPPPAPIVPPATTRTGAVPVPDDVNAPERYISPTPAGVFADVAAALKMTAPTQPDPHRNLGFTTVLSVPRDGLWQGSSALVNLAGPTTADMIVLPAVAMHVSFATTRGTYPASLMGAFAILRQSLITARQYREALALYEQAGGRGIPRPRHDAVSAALLPVLDGKIPVVFKAATAEQIRRAIRFADEFKLRPVIYGGAEAWRVASLLKERNIPVLLDLSFKLPARGTGLSFRGTDTGPEEPANSPKRFAAESNPGRLEKAGVRFAFAGAALERPEQILPQIRVAIARGLSEDAALAALTSAAANILGAPSQLGSIEAGKVADLTLLDGDPFAEKTRAMAVIIDGRFYYPPAPLSPAPVRTAAVKPPVPADGIAPERRPPDPEPPTRDLVIRNATILTVTQGTIENGSLWVRDGKIRELGKNVAAPSGAKVIDATGQYVMPGIIDSHSHSATSGGVNESAPAISPQARIADVFDPDDIDLYRSLAGGVTTLNILHGSANAIGGQNAVIKNKWSRPIEEMLFPGAPRGIKMALGENPKHSNFTSPGPPRYPATRMGVEAVIRESFTRARDYARAWDEYRARSARGEKLLPPQRNVGLDTLADVLAGKILVHAHCYRADEISMLLDLADEFGFKIRSLQHVLEGYKVTAKIRSHGAGASTFADMWGYKMEAFDGTAYNAAAMVKAGIRTAVNSDSDELARRLYGEAAKSMKYGGLTETQALRLITIDPAWMLGVDTRVGSLEPGKDADLAIFNGHPFSPYARVEKTIIDGQVFFDRARDLAQRIPWKEEFELEPEIRRASPPSSEEARHE